MFEDLKGKTLSMTHGLEVGSEEIIFETYEGYRCRLYHERSCCESVKIAEVIGDPRDLEDVPLLEVYVASSGEESFEASGGVVQPGWEPDEYNESFTWTFYRLRTMKGVVTVRWLGESNGYYSERVDFEELPGVEPVNPPALPQVNERAVTEAEESLFRFLRSLRSRLQGGE